MVSCTLSNERRTLTMRAESIGRMSSPGAVAGSEKPRRLCIVSRDPLKCGEFVDALQMSIDPSEEIEIIVDRRRGQPGDESGPDEGDAPSIDRRHHPHLDVMLHTTGFFIVPGSVSVPGSVTVPGRSLAVDSEEDRRRLESILDFESQQKNRRRPWWILAGLVGLGGVIAAALAFFPAAKTLVSRVRLEPPPPVERAATPPVAGQVQTPPVVETPSPPAHVAAPAPSREVAQVPSREVAPPPQGREVTPAPTAEVTPAPSAESRTSSASREIPVRPDVGRPPEARDTAPKREADMSPRAIVAQPREVSPSTVSEPPQAPQRREFTTVRFPGLPRVELVRRPVPERGSDEYAIRVSDATGRPVSGAAVSLILTLAGGIVLDIPLASGPEPGMYHGTAPPDRPAPTNLRVRVVTTDKRIEVPLTR
jgi:hypothetical protein